MIELAKKIIHNKTVRFDSGDEKVSWEVDVSALRQVKGSDWIEDHPTLIIRDLEEMSEMFPRWFLVAGRDTSPVACDECGEYIVPTEGTMRCLACRETYTLNITAIIWTGLLPVQVSGADDVEKLLKQSQERGQLWLPYSNKILYAPVLVAYPRAWPHHDPPSYYTKEFFESLGLNPSSTGHGNHMLHNLQMCLFSDWEQMSIREVIQNRIAPHALAQVKLANGERPKKWFN